jgi:hypothetical protein
MCQLIELTPLRIQSWSKSNLSSLKRLEQLISILKLTCRFLHVLSYLHGLTPSFMTQEKNSARENGDTPNVGSNTFESLV